MGHNLQALSPSSVMSVGSVVPPASQAKRSKEDVYEFANAPSSHNQSHKVRKAQTLIIHADTNEREEEKRIERRTVYLNIFKNGDAPQLGIF